MKVLQCPHLASFSGMTYYCLKGKFPINCETCDCKDKYFVETTTTTTSSASIEDAINNPTYYRTAKKEDKTEVEYTHVDTFIEKAVKWLRESITNNPECNRVLSKKGVITIGELIEDFREYMKGE